jgi:glycosyltransferase involved in cell wall biosynthesis
MRVAVVYPIEFSDEGHIGGGERYAFECARALAAHAETRLVTFGKRRRSRRAGNLRIEVFPRGHLIRGLANNPANPFFLMGLRQVDVIHCIGWNIVPTDLAVLFARSLGKRVVVTDVGGGADFSLRKYLPIDRWVHRFLFLSRYAADLYPQFHDRAEVIYGGADLAHFSPGPGLRERKVLFVGRIIPAKGIEYLIDAVPQDVILNIVGRSYDRRYEADLRRRAAGRNVRFVTDADDARVIEEYRSSLVTVLPSVKRSAYGNYDVPNVLGLVLLESMACGTPVICTDVGPEHELVEEGVTGFVVPPNDSHAMGDRIGSLLGEMELARRMGIAARERILQEFTWDHTARRCLKAYV